MRTLTTGATDADSRPGSTVGFFARDREQRVDHLAHEAGAALHPLEDGARLRRMLGCHRGAQHHRRQRPLEIVGDARRELIELARAPLGELALLQRAAMEACGADGGQQQDGAEQHARDVEQHRQRRGAPAQDGHVGGGDRGVLVVDEEELRDQLIDDVPIVRQLRPR